MRGLTWREWGGGVLSSDAARQMFWVGLMHNGAAGGTYGANGIWQVNRRARHPMGRLHTEKLGGHSLGRSHEAAGGSGEGRWLKQFLTRYPWHRLEPMPDTCRVG